MPGKNVIEIVINAKDDASAVIKTVGTGVLDLGNIGMKALAVGATAAVGGIAALTAGLGACVGAAMEAQQIEAQLNAVLESTKGVAGVTAEAATELANSLGAVTKFEGDAIVAGESLLLTFTGIGKDVFPLATETMLDMSQALGQDMKASATQLGKALQDPIAGVSALAKVGVNFTDVQKDMIKSLVDSGDVVGAQNLILKELQVEFGGAARAAGATFAGKLTILQNRLGDVQETIGGALLPVLTKLIDRVIMPAVPIVEKLADAFVAFIDALAGGEDIAGLSDVLGEFFADILPGSGDVIRDVGEALQDFINKLIALSTSIGPVISAAIAFIVANFDTFKGALEGVAAAMGGAAMVAAIAGIVTLLISLVNPVNLIIVAAGLLGAAWAGNWGGIRDTLTDVWTNTLQPAFAQLYAWMAVNLPIAIQALSNFWTNALQPALASVWSFIVSSVIPAIGEMIAWLAVNLPIAIQTASDFWTNTLQPALAAVWEFVSANVIPLLADLFNWLSVNLPIALQVLSDFWTGILLPALTAAWEFLNTSLLPLLSALAEVVGATLSLAVTALAGLWQNVLLPALTAAWEFINANIVPLFSALATETLPKVGSAFEGISTAIGNVTQFLSGLAKDISSLKLPEWLQPGSPTPFEMGLVGIGTALQALASSELPGFDKALGGVANALINLATTIKSMLDSILAYWKAHNLAVMLDITTTWQNIQITISSALEAIIGLLTLSLQFMAETWNATFTEMNVVVGEIFAAITTTIQDALSNLVNVIIIPTITSLRSWWDTAWGGFKGAVEGLSTTISVSFLNALVALETYLRTSFGPAFKYVLDTYIAPFNTFLDGLARAIITLIGYVDELIEKLRKIKIPEFSSTGATETGTATGGETSSIFAAPSLSTVPATAAGAISPYSAVTTTEAAGGTRLATAGGNTWNVVVNHTKQTERSLADDINFLSFAYGGANAS